MAEQINGLQINLDGSMPELRLHGVDPKEIPVKSQHTPSMGKLGLQKWEPWT